MVSCLALLLAFSVSGTVRSGAHAIVEHFAEGGGSARISEKVRAIVQRQEQQAQDEDPDADADPDADSDLEVVPPPPLPPTPKLPRIQIKIGDEEAREPAQDLPPFSETGRNVAAVGVLHRIARTAGWSLTLVGVAKERIDVDVKEADPREALRNVLKASGAMGVLHRGKLVVVPAPGPGSAGMFVEHTRRRERRRGTRASHGHDMVRVFQGDLVVPAGTVVQGDVVNVGGSIELEPNSVVQGDAVSILGSTVIDQGAVVLGDTAAVLGEVEVQRGGQVMGEHVQIGLGKLFRRTARRHSILSSLGPFGFFPTLALFAVVYLIGLLTLRLWPERVRQVGHAMFEQPLKSFLVGFLCWLLLLPLGLLLLISVIGIPLVPLLPVMIFLAITLGISSLALRLGEALPAGPGQRFVPPAALGMGIVVLLLLAFVPWLGVPLLALLQFFALGAAVSSRLGRSLPPHVP